ncbi:MAG: alpha/beta hydrolase [Opitutales bacterium]|jgi:acetyl esterase/lipase
MQTSLATSKLFLLAKKSRIFLRVTLLSTLLAPMSLAADVPKEIPLWPEGVPGIKADTSNETEQNGIYTHTHHPKLIYYPPKPGTANGTAVIFAPGGGYVRVNIGNGSFFRWLTDNGAAVFVLIYRNQDYGEPAPLQDALRAVRILRSRAAEFGINPDRIGFLGNSAGSHLAASAGTLFNDPAGKTGAPLDAVSGRPDFLILTFPVISMEVPYAHMGSRNALLGPNPSPDVIAHWSLEKQVTKDTPPTFLVHTMEDQVVPVENTILFYEALRQAGVPVEMHLYEKGPHGSGLGPNLGPTSEWPLRAEEWMRFHGWLPPATPNGQ